MKYRIEFDDQGILRECFVESYYTAITLMDVLQRKYTHVYLLIVEPEKLIAEYHA